MKNLKVMICTLIVLMNVSTFAMEQAPRAPQKTEASAKDQELRRRLTNLPGDLQRDVLNRYLYEPYPNLNQIAERIIGLQDLITPTNILVFLKSLKLAHARDLAGLLKGSPILQSKEVQDWIQSIQLEGGEELFIAANSNNPVKVADMLKNPKIDLDWQGVIGRGPSWGSWGGLIRAANEGYDEVVTLLLNAGANPNVVNPNGETALQRAALNGRTEIVRRLIAVGATIDHRGVSPNARGFGQGSLNDTALMIAASHGYLDIVELLLQAGANPDLAFPSAIASGQVEIVQRLLAAGANPTVPITGYRNADIIKPILEQARKEWAQKAKK